MISKAVDSVASLIWGYADGNEKAMKEFKKAVSDDLICNADNACIALASYIADMAEAEEAKRAISDPDVGADIEHMFVAVKKAYTDMLDSVDDTDTEEDEDEDEDEEGV